MGFWWFQPEMTTKLQEIRERLKNAEDFFDRHGYTTPGDSVDLIVAIKDALTVIDALADGLQEARKISGHMAGKSRSRDPNEDAGKLVEEATSLNRRMWELLKKYGLEEK